MDQKEIVRQSIAKKPKRKIWLVILIIAVIIILLWLIGWLTYAWRTNVKKIYELQNTSTSTSATSSASTPSANKSISSTSTSGSSEDQYLTSCQETAQGFMDARKDRDLEEAKPYVTSDFLANYDAASFAGVSSPGVDSFDVGDVKIMSKDANYDIPITVHWILSGEPSGDTNWTLYSIIIDGKCLVNDYDAPM